MSTSSRVGKEMPGSGAPAAGNDEVDVTSKEVGKGDDRVPVTVLNEDRRLVLVGDPSGREQEEQEEEEEEYAFEDDGEAVNAPPKWMAIARYYSGQEFKTWVLFNELSKA